MLGVRLNALPTRRTPGQLQGRAAEANGKKRGRGKRARRGGGESATLNFAVQAELVHVDEGAGDKRGGKCGAERVRHDIGIFVVRRPLQQAAHALGGGEVRGAVRSCLQEGVVPESA